MSEDPLHYANPNLPGRPGRTLSQWSILLIAWGAGLVIWLVYSAVVVLVVMRFL